MLELRFPIPQDVQLAFRDAHGKPRKAVIRSLGTSDVNLANAKADLLRTQIREDIQRAREAKEPHSLGDFLRWLYDYDLASFKLSRAYRAKRDLASFVDPHYGERMQADRLVLGAALTSTDPQERRAVAGWAADEFFHRRGEQPNPQSPEYAEVVEECARVLVDGVLAMNEMEAGRPPPAPISERLANVIASKEELANALTDQGRLPLSVYFEEVYAANETREGAPVQGERNIPGKRYSVRLFKELIGDKPICSITKGDLYDFLNKLGRFPDGRLLSGDYKQLSAGKVLEKVRSGELKVAPIHPKTANKHLSSLSAVLEFAEKRRHVDRVDSKGVKARFEDHEDAGRPFTTDELNRIFALPLFAGCAGEDVEGGLFKPGPIKIRDDRFWIPLTLLFTGARSSEIVGLLTAEVVIDVRIR